MKSCTNSKPGLLVAALLLTGVAFADCMYDIRGQVVCGAGQCLIDRNGRVWCSRHDRGGIVITLDGQALCGVGQCAKDSRGNVFCSSLIGGKVLVDSTGRVRCYGECLPGTRDACESTPADSSSS